MGWEENILHFSVIDSGRVAAMPLMRVLSQRTLTIPCEVGTGIPIVQIRKWAEGLPCQGHTLSWQTAAPARKPHFKPQRDDISLPRETKKSSSLWETNIKNIRYLTSPP